MNRKVTGAQSQGGHTRDVSIVPVSLHFFGICVCFLVYNIETSLLIWCEGALWRCSLKCGFSSNVLIEWRVSKNHVTLELISLTQRECARTLRFSLLIESNVTAKQGMFLAVSVTQKKVIYKYFLRKCRFFKKSSENTAKRLMIESENGIL